MAIVTRTRMCHPRMLAMLVLPPLVWSPVAHSQDDAQANPSSQPPQPQRTDITPVLDTPIREGRNLVYCGTFQMAWDQLQAFLGEDVILDKALRWTRLLNETTFSPTNLPPGSHYVAAGLVGNGVVDDIERALRRQFDEALPFSREGLEPRHIIAFAYLQLELAFAETFDAEGLAIPFESDGHTEGVAAFGISPKRRSSEREMTLREQIAVLFHDDDSSFALALRPAGDRVRIVLAKVPARETLGATIAAVKEFSDLPDRSPAFREPVLIPRLSWKLEHEFAEIQEAKLKSKRYPGYYIARAWQNIRFALDERGVALTSDAGLMLKSKKGFRRFVFDRPFLVYLQLVDDPHPLFAAWVGNTEPMEITKEVPAEISAPKPILPG